MKCFGCEWPEKGPKDTQPRQRQDITAYLKQCRDTVGNLFFVKQRRRWRHGVIHPTLAEVENYLKIISESNRSKQVLAMIQKRVSKFENSKLHFFLSFMASRPLP